MSAPRIDQLNSATNLAIGGGFDIWQRGTSFTVSTSDQYTADRFSCSKTASYTGTSTAARSTSVPTAAQSSFASQYSHSLTNGTALASPAATDLYIGLQYKMEGQDYALIGGGQSITVQFWARSSVTGTFYASFANSAQDRSYVAPYTISSANTWEKKTITLTTDSAGTWLYDNGIGLRVRWCVSAGSNFNAGAANTWSAGNFYQVAGATNWAGTTGATLNIAQVMIVRGSFTSLTFQRAGKTIGDELRMCQRYYLALNGGAVNNSFATGTANTTSSFYGRVIYPVQMRAVPTIGSSGTASDLKVDGTNAVTASSTPAIFSASIDAATLLVSTPATLVAGQCYHLTAATTSGKLTFDSEL